jgi:hypothetical protein
MKKLLMSVSLLTVGSLSYGQIGFGGGALTITDNQGHNVFVSACSNSQCNAHNFTTSVSSYTYPALSAAYTFLDITWSASSGTTYPFFVTLADVDAAPGGVKSYLSSGALLTVTKQGPLSYSFIVETPLGGI